MNSMTLSVFNEPSQINIKSAPENMINTQTAKPRENNRIHSKNENREKFSSYLEKNYSNKEKNIKKSNNKVEEQNENQSYSTDKTSKKKPKKQNSSKNKDKKVENENSFTHMPIITKTDSKQDKNNRGIDNFLNAIKKSEKSEKFDKKLSSSFLDSIKNGKKIDDKNVSTNLVHKKNSKETKVKNLNLSSKEKTGLDNFLNAITKSKNSEKADKKLAISFLNSIKNNKNSNKKITFSKNNKQSIEKNKTDSLLNSLKSKKNNNIENSNKIFSKKIEDKQSNKLFQVNEKSIEKDKNLEQNIKNKKVKISFKQVKENKFSKIDLPEHTEVLNKKDNLKSLNVKSDNEIFDKLQSILEKHQKNKEFKNQKNFKENENQFSRNFSNDSLTFKTSKISQNIKTEQQTPKLDFNNIIEQIKKSIKPPIKNEITIQLKPENLGKIKITLSMENNNLKANIMAEHKDVQHTMMQNMQQLEGALKEKGINLSNFTITVANDQNFEKNNHQSQFQNKKKNKFKVSNFENFTESIDSENNFNNNINEIKENSNLNIKI